MSIIGKFPQIFIALSHRARVTYLLHPTFCLAGPAHKSIRSQNVWTSNVAGPRVYGTQVSETIFLRKTTEEKLALNLCSLYLKELNEKPDCL